MPSATPSAPPLISGTAVNGAPVVPSPALFSSAVVSVPRSSWLSWPQPVVRTNTNRATQISAPKTFTIPTFRFYWPDEKRATRNLDGSVVGYVVHVLVPVPVLTRISVVGYASVLAWGVWVGYLIVTYDMGAIERDTVLVDQVGREPGGGIVHGLGEPLRVGDIAFVLYTYAGLVVAQVPRVPADVFLSHRLAQVAVRGAHRVVGRSPGPGVLEPVEGARPGPLRDVDDYLVDEVRVGAVRHRVVAGARR